MFGRLDGMGWDETWEGEILIVRFVRGRVLPWRE